MTAPARTDPDSHTSVTVDDGNRPSGERSRPTSRALEMLLDHASPDRPIALGDYRVMRRVGAGGVGIVYEARDARENRVALKILRDPSVSAVSRLKEEFRLVADVADEHLGTVHALVVEGDDAYLILPFVDGVDFISYVRHSGAYEGPTVGTDVSYEGEAFAGSPDSSRTLSDSSEVRPVRRRTEPSNPPCSFDLGRLRPALRQLARAVQSLHDAGCLHRDLKPSNVLVDGAGNVVVLDFGLVRERVDPTDVGGIVGTPSHMAPEQARGEPAQAASDWYAFGVMMFEALTGTLPFRGTRAEVLEKKRREAPPRASTVGTDVPPELDELAARLFALSPDERPDVSQIFRVLGVEEPRRVPRSEVSTFVGRQAELTQLHAALDARGGGACVVRWIHGGSGMGKTALLRRFLEEVRIRLPDALVLRGRCHPREWMPYKAFDGVVERLAAELVRSPSRAALDAPAAREKVDLVAMFPAFGGVFSLDKGPHDGRKRDAAGIRASGLRALKLLLSRLAEERPIIIAVDDLQWADADSVHVLSEIATAPAAPRLVFLGLYRTEERPRSSFLREITRALPEEMTRPEAEIALSPLSDGDALELANARLDDTDRLRADAIARAAAGHPFFIEEFIRYARQRGGVGETPPSLEEVLRARVDALPSDARHVLELVAVAGDTLDPEVMARLALPGADPLALLKRLSATSLIRLSGLRANDRIEAYHDRIGESVVAMIDPASLAAHHLALGEALSARGSKPEILARHFIAGGSLALGCHHALDAAEASWRALAFEHAAELFGLALSSGSLSREEKRRVRIRRADALANAGRTTEAATIYAEESALETGDERLDLKRRAAEQYLVAGHFIEGTELLEQVLTGVGLDIPTTPFRTNLASLRALLSVAALHARARLPFRKAHSSSEGAKLRAAFTAARGLAAFDLARGAYFSIEMTRLALRTGDRALSVRGLAAVGSMVAYPNLRPFVQWGTAMLEDAIKLASGASDPGLLASAKVHVGLAHMTAGDWTRAVETLTPALAELAERCAGYQHELSYGQMSAIQCLEALGQLREVRARATRALRDGDATGNYYLRVHGSLFLAVSDVAAGRLHDAENHERALDAWTGGERGFLFQHWFGLKARVYRALYEGAPRAAVEALAAAWPGLRQSNMLAIQFLKVLTLQLRAHAKIHLAVAARTGKRALLTEAERDAADIEKTGSSAGHAAALAIRGAASRERGDVERALALFSRSEQRYGERGMRLYAASVRRQRGLLEGGDAGDALVRGADEAMRAEGVAEPAKWGRIYAP